jgi:hypothetical protein
VEEVEEVEEVEKELISSKGKVKSKWKVVPPTTSPVPPSTYFFHFSTSST